MSKNIIEVLKNNFPEQEFEYETVSYEGSIHTFFIKSKNEEQLNNTWENIRNMIGVYFQSKLESEFEIWNVYLFFVMHFTISKDLKHKIEHDTLSSRKIVVENHERMDDSNFKDYLFTENITNDNLKVNISTLENKKFSENKLISTIIDKFDISIDKRNKEFFLGEVLDKLEKSLKNEI